MLYYEEASCRTGRQGALNMCRSIASVEQHAYTAQKTPSTASDTINTFLSGLHFEARKGFRNLQVPVQVQRMQATVRRRHPERHSLTSYSSDTLLRSRRGGKDLQTLPHATQVIFCPRGGQRASLTLLKVSNTTVSITILLLCLWLSCTAHGSMQALVLSLSDAL